MKLPLLLLCLGTILDIGEFVQGPPNCDFEHTVRTYFCKNINNVFPNVFYGNYHLKCVDCNITTFSDKTFPYTNSLISLNVSESGIKHITKGAFATLSNVQYVYLQANEISKVDPEAFLGLRQVYEVHLDDNRIENIVPGFLKGLESSVVGLRNNKIKTLPDRGFEGSLNILILDLSNNLIKTIDKDAFLGLDDLEVLNLEKNKICYLPLAIFKHLSALKDLNLADNKLSRFTIGTFSGLKNLNNLNLANNSLSVFDGNFLIPFNHLSKLDISGNGIYYFDANSIHVSVPTLRVLRMDDNLWSCVHLINMIHYFKKVRVEVESSAGRYDVQNVNGIACADIMPTQSVDFDKFLKVVEEDTKRTVKYC